MSSSANGRYQSRLFNFLNRQSHRLKDQCDRAVRHAKVAASWGVQILLYPVYLTVQATRFAGHQLKQTVQQQWLQLQASKPSEAATPPPADTPIQEVLRTVDTFAIAGVQVQKLVEDTQPLPLVEPAVDASTDLIPVAASALEAAITITETPSEAVVSLAEMPLVAAPASELQPQPSLIAGVATLLATRRLVLVTTENQILDILTPQQQQNLLQRIHWEIADYWRQWRLIQGTQRKFTGRVSEGRSHVLPPMRLFWRLMAWVQTSPVAIATNLFQESALVNTENLQLSYPNLEATLYPPGILAESNFTETVSEDNLQLLPATSPFEQRLILLDRTVAELETHPLESVTELTVAIAQQTQTLLQRVQAKVQQPVVSSPASLDAPESNSFKIQLLIRAAIDYFFGRRGGQLPQTAGENQSPASFSGTSSIRTHHLPGQRSDTSSVVGDPWLVWEDLFTSLDTPLTEPQPDPWTDSANPTSPPNKLPGKSHTSPALPGHVEIPPENIVWSLVKRRLRFKKADLQHSPPASDAGEKRPRQTAAATQSPSKPASVASIPDGIRVSVHTTSLLERSVDSTAQIESSLIRPVTSRTPNTSLDHTPDWIETKATPTGYVKHPLEQLLEWLDFAMLWLEEMLMKIWRWIKQLG